MLVSSLGSAKFIVDRDFAVVVLRMASSLQGFPRRNLLSRRAPEVARTVECSYCDATLHNDEIPLIIWNADGWVAEFCEACQHRWWGRRR
jgi:hypothetical protein